MEHGGGITVQYFLTILSWMRRGGGATEFYVRTTTLHPPALDRRSRSTGTVMWDSIVNIVWSWAVTLQH